MAANVAIGVMRSSAPQDPPERVCFRWQVLGRKFLLAARAAFSRLAENATAHPVLDRVTGTRRALLRKFPYRVLYLIEGDRVVVFAVMHHRRDDLQWRDRL